MYRSLLRTLCTTALLSLVAPGATAQSFPQKTVRILVGFAPGGSTDLTARIYAQEFARAWGQQVIVDNRPGASGLIAGELTAKAPGDGYTLLVSPQTTTVVAPLIMKKLGFDPRELMPLAVIGSTPQLLVLHPSIPTKDFKEFTAFVKSNYKNLSFGSGGIGSTPHMAGELFNTSLGVRVIHVPYKGENPGVADLLAGQIPFMFSNFPVVYPHVQSGRLRAVAITSPQRSQLAPEIPTVAESGVPGFDTATWSGLYAPPKTARDAVQRIAADVLKIKSGAEFQKRMLAQGIDMSSADTPEKHAAFIKVEFDRWGKVAREAGVRVE